MKILFLFSIGNITTNKLHYISSILNIWLIITLIPGCGTRRLTHEQLDGVLWMKTSGEYAALGLQAFKLARFRLEEALNDSNWTAEIEQQSQEYSHLPPAIIVDVDETILNNTPFQVRMIKNNQEFDFEMWQEWVHEAKASAIPGAVELLQFAHSKGIEIFYITNRDCWLEQSTMENLKRLGFPLSADLDNILTKSERDDWGTDKASRRKYVAKSYRILLLIGDDLNDFISVEALRPPLRVELTEESISMWATKWIILPNPNYGSWEDSLFNSDVSLKDSERLSIKYKMLVPLND